MLDQYMTDEEVAESLVRSVVTRYDPLLQRRYLEPASGTGAFVRALEDLAVKKIVSNDIDTRMYANHHCDFIDSSMSWLSYYREQIVIGNPPFGTRGATAEKFLARAFTFGDLVCFVMPRRFRGGQRIKLPSPKIALVHERLLPAGAFNFEVKTVWQEWARFYGSWVEDREPSKPELVRKGYELVPHAKYLPGRDVCIQRAGRNAGAVASKDIPPCNKYYVRPHSNIVRKALRRLRDFTHCIPEAFDTTQQPALTHELLDRLVRAAVAEEVLS